MPPSRSLFILVVATVLAAPAPLAAQISATDKGSLLVGGSAGYSSMSYGSEAGRVSQLNFTPRLQLFVSSRVAVGAALAIDRWQQGDAMIRHVGLGPVVNWYVLPGPQPVLPYLTASATYGRRTAENTSNVQAGSFLGYRAGAGALYLLNPHVGLNGEVYFDAVRGRMGDAEPLIDRDTVGVALGFAVFLFGSR